MPDYKVMKLGHAFPSLNIFRAMNSLGEEAVSKPAHALRTLKPTTNNTVYGFHKAGIDDY